MANRNFDSLPEDIQKRYELHLKNLRNEASRAYTMKVDAEDRVKKDEKIQIAKGMKSDGVSTETIIKYTGLPKEEIEKHDPAHNYPSA